jgi:thiol:disulfide interchange protein DsbD
MESNDGDGRIWYSFGFAICTFAAFPGWMNSIPKSGGWLNTVKVVLGFIEVALAFKFLSNADLVKHWGLLKIEPFLLIWIAVAVGLFAYLMGWIRFPHDSKLKKLSPVRGTLHLIRDIPCYGLYVQQRNKNLYLLSLLSGLAPPVGYSILYQKIVQTTLTAFMIYKKV